MGGGGDEGEIAEGCGEDRGVKHLERDLVDEPGGPMETEWDSWSPEPRGTSRWLESASG